MGSLPGPGWAETFSSSPPAYRRSMSATRQEIDTFHKELQRKSLDGQSAEQDAQDAMRRSQTMSHQSVSPRQSDSPRSIVDGGALDREENPENVASREAWWRRSNWAFLNDPPTMDVKDGARGYNYGAQHKLAARTIGENASLQ